MDETAQIPELTRRQEHILSLIVKTYSHNPEPVSSRTLVEQYELGISSATVRNEMAYLEEMGYIVAPHTSAGRIPTARGYRYFVRELLNNSELSLVEQKHIESRFRALPTVLEQWLRQAATVLARTASSASIVTPPVSQNRQFKHLELISIQGRLALMVLVLQGGTVHQRMLSLADSLSQVALSETADRINRLCNGLKATDLRVKAHTLPLLEREVVELAADLMDRGTTSQARQIYRDGLSEIINTFPDSLGAQQAVRVFEERAFLDMILTELLEPLLPDDDEDGDVQVFIAGDNRWDEISRLSIILARYGIPGQMTGTLGVVGPTHLNYGRAISTVRQVSGLMTDMVVDLYDNEDTATNNTAHTDSGLPADPKNA